MTPDVLSHDLLIDCHFFFFNPVHTTSSQTSCTNPFTSQSIQRIVRSCSDSSCGTHFFPPTCLPYSWPTHWRPIRRSIWSVASLCAFVVCSIILPAFCDWTYVDASRYCMAKIAKPKSHHWRYLPIAHPSGRLVCQRYRTRRICSSRSISWTSHLSPWISGE